jgi:hypothetical protein
VWTQIIRRQWLTFRILQFSLRISQEYCSRLGSGGIIPIPIFSRSRALVHRDRDRDGINLYGTGSGLDQLFRDGINYFIPKYCFLLIQKFDLIFRKNKTKKGMCLCQKNEFHKRSINKVQGGPKKTYPLSIFVILKTRCIWYTDYLLFQKLGASITRHIDIVSFWNEKNSRFEIHIFSKNQKHLGVSFFLDHPVEEITNFVLIFKFIFASNDIVTVYSIFLRCRRRECEEIWGNWMDNERQCIDQIKISGVEKENTSLSERYWRV